MPAFQDCALVSSVLVKVLHFIPRMPLSLLNAALEDEYLLLLSRKLSLLIAQGCFYSFEYLNVVLSGCQ
jgi:hypothetical protein